MQQEIFISGEQWQTRPFRFRPRFAPERSAFLKPFHEAPLMEWLFIK